MPSRLAHRLAALAALVVTLLVATSAYAWVETELLAAESRVQLHRDGTAQVRHKVTFRVRGGPLRSLDLAISDRQIALSSDASLTTSGDSLAPKTPIPVAVEQRPDGDLRIEIDEKRGVRKGVYDLELGYDVDLLQAGGITRDGSMLSVTWAGPPWQDGLDNVKCVLAVPASATVPRPAFGGQTDASMETGAGSVGSYLTTIARLPEFDEVTLIRPHVARGEVVPWAIRIDPAAIGEVNDPRLHPPSTATVQSTIPPQHRALLLGLGALVAVGFSLLLALKHRQVLAACRERGVDPRPLVPLGIAARVAFAGPLLGAALAAQAWMTDPTLGSVAILAVVVMAAYRTPVAQHAPRGPGRWLPLTDEDAFRTEKSSGSGWLDASTTSGRIVWVLGTLAYAAAVYGISRWSMYHAHLAALDYVVVAAVFGTGRRAQLPADARATAGLLSELADSLRKSATLSGARVRAIGRIPTGASAPDEIRLTLSPRRMAHGFRAIEIGIAWAQSPGGPVPFFQALLRVVDGSACYEGVSERMRKARWLRGREAYERVLSLAPTLPTADHTQRLVEALVRAAGETTAQAAPAQQPRRETRQRRQPRPAASSSVRKPSGMSSRTSKDGTDALPFHTTW